MMNRLLFALAVLFAIQLLANVAVTSGAPIPLAVQRQAHGVQLDKRSGRDDLWAAAAQFYGRNTDAAQSQAPDSLHQSFGSMRQPGASSSQLMAPPPQHHPAYQTWSAQGRAFSDPEEMQMVARLYHNVPAEHNPAQQALPRPPVPLWPSSTAFVQGSSSRARRGSQAGSSAGAPQPRRANFGGGAPRQVSATAPGQYSVPLHSGGGGYSAPHSAAHAGTLPSSSVQPALIPSSLLLPNAQPTERLRKLLPSSGLSRNSKSGLTEDRRVDLYSEQPSDWQAVSKRLTNVMAGARNEIRDAVEADDIGKAFAWRAKYDADFAAREGVVRRQEGLSAPEAELYAEAVYAYLRAAADREKMTALSGAFISMTLPRSTRKVSTKQKAAAQNSLAAAQPHSRSASTGSMTNFSRFLENGERLQGDALQVRTPQYY